MSKSAFKWILRYIRMYLDLLERFAEGGIIPFKPERLLTLEEVSEYTSYNPGTLKNYCREGKIPCTKQGKRYLINEAVAFDIDNYVSVDRRETPKKVKA